MDLNTVKAKFMEGLQKEVAKKRVQETVGGTIKRGMVHARRQGRAFVSGAKAAGAKGIAHYNEMHDPNHPTVNEKGKIHAGRAAMNLGGAIAVGAAAGATGATMAGHTIKSAKHGVHAIGHAVHGRIKDAAKSAAKSVGHGIAAHPAISAAHALHTLNRRLHTPHPKEG